MTTPQDFSAEAFQEIASFRRIFNARDFMFLDEVACTVSTFDNAYHPEVHRFLNVLHTRHWIRQNPEFEWSKWHNSLRGQSLHNNLDLVAHATPAELSFLLSVFHHAERCNAGAQMDYHHTGLLNAVLKRTEHVAASMGHALPKRTPREMYTAVFTALRRFAER